MRDDESSPVNYRRLDWFSFNPNVTYGWSDLGWHLKPRQAALVRGAHHGYMPRTDPVEPRSYLSYYLE